MNPLKCILDQVFPPFVSDGIYEYARLSVRHEFSCGGHSFTWGYLGCLVAGCGKRVMKFDMLGNYIDSFTHSDKVEVIATRDVLILGGKRSVVTANIDGEVISHISAHGIFACGEDGRRALIGSGDTVYVVQDGICVDAISDNHDVYWVSPCHGGLLFEANHVTHEYNYHTRQIEETFDGAIGVACVGDVIASISGGHLYLHHQRTVNMEMEFTSVMAAGNMFVVQHDGGFSGISVDGIIEWTVHHNYSDMTVIGDFVVTDDNTAVCVWKDGRKITSLDVSDQLTYGLEIIAAGDSIALCFQYGDVIVLI